MATTDAAGMAVFDQYSNARPFFQSRPSWVDGQDQDRLAAYAFYDQIYWNAPESFKLIQRGEELNPIYIPSGQQIVDTVDRYMANSLSFIVDPNFGMDAERLNAQNAINSLVKRERFYSRFNSNKRDGMIRGDWLFHLYADPQLPQGSRLSIFALDPSKFFPIYFDSTRDYEKLVGCHLVEYVQDANGKPAIYRLTYRKTTGQPGPSTITVEEGLFDLDKWQLSDAVPTTVIRPPEVLPAPINQIPVYHIQNEQESGTIWGSSELRGLERIITAVNQSITDEDLALSLEALGVYATDAGSPVDEDTGQTVAWNIGPGRVIEIPEGSKFTRVNGITTVAPYQEHLKYLHNQLDQSKGISAVAKGEVDVKVAESGIALTLELAPLLTRAEKKEQIVTDVLNNMLFDLKAWFQAYEGMSFGEAIWQPVYGDKIPVNRKQKFDEIMALAQATPTIVSMEWIWNELNKLGFEIKNPTDLMSQILGNKEMIGKVEADALGMSMDAQIAAQGGTPPSTGGGGSGGAGATTVPSGNGGSNAPSKL